jgi:hypothetical protein
MSETRKVNLSGVAEEVLEILSGLSCPEKLGPSANGVACSNCGRESFDYICSIGVLHHTADCEHAYRGLPRLLKRNLLAIEEAIAVQRTRPRTSTSVLATQTREVAQCAE